MSGDETRRSFFVRITRPGERPEYGDVRAAAKRDPKGLPVGAVVGKRAAILRYDRHLSDLELEQVMAWLTRTFPGGSPGEVQASEVGDNIFGSWTSPSHLDTLTIRPCPEPGFVRIAYSSDSPGSAFERGRQTTLRDAWGFLIEHKFKRRPK